MDKLEEVNEIIDKASEKKAKSKRGLKALKKIGNQTGKQLTAIFGMAIATGIGVVVARLVWEWIKFVWAF